MRLLKSQPFLGYLVLLGAAACSSQPSQDPPFNLSTAGAQGVTAGTGGDPTASGGSGGAPQMVGVAGGLIAVPKNTGGANGSGGDGNASGTGGAEATGGRTVTENCASTKASAMDITTVRPADIIFAIDSSTSMVQEIEFVQMYMNEFSEQIVASGIDVRVILIAGAQDVCIGAPLGSGQCAPMGDDTNLPSYVHIPQPVGSNDALTQIIDTYPLWQQYLRPEATKSFVVITDDNATTNNVRREPRVNSAQLFTEELAMLDPMMFQEWTFNGVYCFTDCPESFAVGTVYAELVEATMGVGGDLCLQDFQPVFDRLAKQIITNAGSTIACEWELPPPVAGQSFSRDLVEVARTTGAGTTPLARVNTEADCANGGWYFNSLLNPTQILACPNTCMEMQNQSGGKIDITFGCEAVGGCVPMSASTVSDGNPGACDWAIPEPPQGQAIDYKSVNVRYTSPSGFASNLGNVAAAPDCSMVEHGWYYDEPNNPKRIFACPQTCEEVKAGGATAKVEVLFGCETVPAPVR